MMHTLAFTVVLQIHNLAGVPAAVIRGAECELTRLYHEIGVRVDWNNRPTATVWSAHGTPVVYLFYRRVRAESERYAASIALVLACTLAHELGHLLMPGHGHTPEGLMRAQWGGDEVHRAEQGGSGSRPRTSHGSATESWTVCRETLPSRLKHRLLPVPIRQRRAARSVD